MFKKIKILLMIFIISFNAYSVTPAVYGAASFIPGLGQTFNGHYFEGAAWFLTTLGLMGSRDTVLRSIGWDIWQYNMYDAWKDAGGKPSNDHFVGYEYIQNFNPVNIADPFAIGFLGMAAANRSKAKNNKDNKDATDELKGVSTLGSIAMFTFVGLGEESLFRGFLYPAFSSWLSPWGGAIVSSAAFSFAHVGASSGGNAARFIMGMLFCWQYTRNKYQLAGNVFTHSWYDQILVGNMSIQNPNNEKFNWRDPPIGVTLTFKF